MGKLQLQPHLRASNESFSTLIDSDRPLQIRPSCHSLWTWLPRMVKSTGGVKWGKPALLPEPGTIGHIVLLSSQRPGPSDYNPHDGNYSQPKGGGFSKSFPRAEADHIPGTPAPHRHASAGEPWTQMPSPAWSELGCGSYAGR
jgi:hypothetical protein